MEHIQGVESMTPAEVWADITDGCIAMEDVGVRAFPIADRRGVMLSPNGEYRLRKVHVSNWHNEERTVMPEWAFIVERKEE